MAGVVSLQTTKQFLCIDGSNEDGFLNLLLELVEGAVSDYLGCTLASTQYVDEILQYKESRNDYRYNPKLDYSDEQLRLYLKNYPVISLDAFTQGGEAISSDDYTLRASEGHLDMYVGYSDYKARLRATYTAGYTESTLPAGLKKVILDGVRYMYEGGAAAKRGNGQVDSKKIGDFSVSYAGNSSVYDGKQMEKFIAQNAVILDTYRRITLA